MTTEKREKIEHWATVGGVRLGMHSQQDSETVDTYYDAYLQKAGIDESTENSEPDAENLFRKHFFLAHSSVNAWVVNPPNNGEGLQKISLTVYV